jgi:hypothetical protein
MGFYETVSMKHETRVSKNRYADLVQQLSDAYERRLRTYSSLSGLALELHLLRHNLEHLYLLNLIGHCLFVRRPGGGMHVRRAEMRIEFLECHLGCLGICPVDEHKGNDIEAHEDEVRPCPDIGDGDRPDLTDDY